MAEFEYLNTGNTEAQDKLATAFLLAQTTTAGKAATGVLSGLGVTQTGTASGSVLIAAGAGVAQNVVSDGASILINDTQKTLDIFTSNPMSGVANPRNDIVVFDALIPSIRSITGTPNASPVDPTVPGTCLPLARLRHAAGATTIPTAKIDSLIVLTSLFGAKPSNQRSGWGIFTGNLGAGGAINFSHGMPFTPTVVLPNDPEADASTGDIAWKIGVSSISSTVVSFVCYKYDGTYLPVGTNVTVHAWFGE